MNHNIKANSVDEIGLSTREEIKKYLRRRSVLFSCDNERFNRILIFSDGTQKEISLIDYYAMLGFEIGEESSLFSRSLGIIEHKIKYARALGTIERKTLERRSQKKFRKRENILK